MRHDRFCSRNEITTTVTTSTTATTTKRSIRIIREYYEVWHVQTDVAYIRTSYTHIATAKIHHVLCDTSLLWPCVRIFCYGDLVCTCVCLCAWCVIRRSDHEPRRYERDPYENEIFSMICFIASNIILFVRICRPADNISVLTCRVSDCLMLFALVYKQIMFKHVCAYICMCFKYSHTHIIIFTELNGSRRASFLLFGEHENIHTQTRVECAVTSNKHNYGYFYQNYVISKNMCFFVFHFVFNSNSVSNMS